MNSSTYYKKCTNEPKNLKGLLGKGKLSNETLKLINTSLEIKHNSYKPFINEISEIIEIDEELKGLLESVCSEIMPVSDKLFNCNSKVQEIKILKHLKQDTNNIETGAFMWHSDRHVNELVNIMLYLNDVTEVKHGPFQYIEKNGEPYYNLSIAKSINNEQAISYGEVKSLLGKAGSFYIFDNNFLHRAAVPTEKNRDAIIFQVRPTRKKQTNFIDLNYIKQPYPIKISNWDKYE